MAFKISPVRGIKYLAPTGGKDDGLSLWIGCLNTRFVLRGLADTSRTCGSSRRRGRPCRRNAPCLEMIAPVRLVFEMTKLVEFTDRGAALERTHELGDGYFRRRHCQQMHVIHLHIEFYNLRPEVL